MGIATLLLYRLSGAGDAARFLHSRLRFQLLDRLPQNVAQEDHSDTLRRIGLPGKKHLHVGSSTVAEPTPCLMAVVQPDVLDWQAKLKGRCPAPPGLMWAADVSAPRQQGA